jgi:hypothetical protein
MKLLLLLTFLLSNLYPQAIVGSWELKEHYSDGKLVTSAPYLKYQFVAPDHWKISVKQGMDKGDFNFNDSGQFSVRGHRIELKLGDEVIDGVCTIYGYSLLIIKMSEAKMIFGRIAN